MFLKINPNHDSHAFPDSATPPACHGRQCIARRSPPPHLGITLSLKRTYPMTAQTNISDRSALARLGACAIGLGALLLAATGRAADQPPAPAISFPANSSPTPRLISSKTTMRENRFSRMSHSPRRTIRGNRPRRIASPTITTCLPCPPTSCRSCHSTTA